MSRFGTLQGFLWVSLALSLNEKEGIFCFSIMTCCVGVAVYFFTAFNVQKARANKKENLERWNSCYLENATTTYRFNVPSLGLEERRSSNNVNGWFEPIPTAFIIAWGYY
jgi:hypothetical protein